MHSTFSLSAASPQGTLSLSRSSQDRSSVQPVDSAELLQGQKAVQIQHNGAIYRLQATKLGKLILTK
ncbi:MAG: hypothetical protein GAK30_02198 [Paracidovorax wautersii]|uniref:Hemin uptake protein HemP n=1 Tax=Paracidovorax wautersii TaxID=1177982 RepID=A0A7V8JQ92_9BURK|nr:MAG: hypothetical protein GAK30_02198 [Paracidovorax wautersii]